MQIVFIGAGRLATNLAPALLASGHQIVQVFSRTGASAQALAFRVNAEPVTDLAAVSEHADVYIFSVSDAALPVLLAKFKAVSEDAVFLHTAGSMPMSVFQNVARHYGVLYPMQTFSKDRQVDFARIPFFIEGSDRRALEVSRTLASSVSKHVQDLSTEARRHLHLAAVFACNFVNHCYQLSAEVLDKYHLPFDIMLPLIDETAEKVHSLSPIEAQTGPAIRYDENVMQAQLQLLADAPRLAEIYALMSKSIHQSYIDHS